MLEIVPNFKKWKFWGWSNNTVGKALHAAYPGLTPGFPPVPQAPPGIIPKCRGSNNPEHRQPKNQTWKVFVQSYVYE